MKSVVPHTFRTSAIVDGETINGNLRRQASDVARNLDARYTYIPPIIVPFDGVTNALTTQLRTVLFNRPSSTNPIEIVRVEFFVYAASGVTWTLSANQLGGALTPPWGSITLATAGLTTEAYAVSTTVIPVSTFGVQFEVSGSAAGAITRGWIVLHCRADRGVQGAAPNHSSYTPTYVDAASSSAGSVLDTQLTALATAVTNANVESAQRCWNDGVGLQRQHHKRGGNVLYDCGHHLCGAGDWNGHHRQRHDHWHRLKHH